MKHLKRYAVLVFFLLLTGFGAALSLKAAVGVGPYDALAQSLSMIVSMKVGTVGIILNSLCVVAQVILLGKNFRWQVLMQLLVGFTVGFFINFIYYDLLGTLEISNYALRIVTVVFSYILTSLGVSAVLVLDIVSFCLEGICMVISDKFALNFARFRQMVDVVFIIAVIILTALFPIGSTIREGSVISMLMFGPLLAFFMPRLKGLFLKYDLISA